MQARFWLTAGLTLATTMASAASAAPEESPKAAVMAPLAVQRLLLDVAALPDGRLVAVGERGHVLTSQDSGATWRQSPVPVNASLTAVYFTDARHGWAVGHDEVIVRTADGGASWTLNHYAPARQQPLLDVWFDAAGHGFAIGAFSTVYRSGDGGASWQGAVFAPQPLPAPPSVPHGASVATAAVAPKDAMHDDEGIAQPHLNAIAADGRGRLYIAGEAGHLFRSDDAGEHWFVLPSPYAGSFFGLLPLAGDALLAFGLRGHLYRSEDAGRTWEALPSGTEALLAGATRLADGTIVIVGLAGAVLVSSDQGHHFALLQQSDRKAFDAVAAVPGGVLVVGESGARRIELAPRAPDARGSR